jgi:hypothetical protein
MIAERVHQDGLWGFTGNDSPPPSPSTLPECLPALADWGVTRQLMVVSPKATEEEAVLVKEAARQIQEYVQNRWSEDEWETAWFVNPPVSRRPSETMLRLNDRNMQRLQSVPGLAHIHVFARHKRRPT